MRAAPAQEARARRGALVLGLEQLQGFLLGRPPRPAGMVLQHEVAPPTSMQTCVGWHRCSRGWRQGHSRSVIAGLLASTMSRGS
ncbi:MAG: hypothetical protein A3I79_05690 [Gemmatimonadetes bacterium RIFCSPLOWO2_02_FULL_71_11]|nr:MAG: hypothetical protein A3I79_05690 [Gemmatimonadetes bacterium RIFCSPLOWO2_02_FULL_71_11]